MLTILHIRVLCIRRIRRTLITRKRHIQIKHRRMIRRGRIKLLIRRNKHTNTNNGEQYAEKRMWNLIRIIRTMLINTKKHYHNASNSETTAKKNTNQTATRVRNIRSIRKLLLRTRIILRLIILRRKLNMLRIRRNTRINNKLRHVQ